MLVRLPALALALVGAMSCDKQPADLREWKATDHGQSPQANQAAPSRAPVSRAAPAPGAAGAPNTGIGEALAHRGLNEEILQVWVERCVSCHGTIGRGDGPQAAAVRARDLSEPAWQASVSDNAIESSILKGRGMMPAFPLPPATVQGLTKLVRLFVQRSAVPASAAGGAPSGPTKVGTP